MYHLYIWDLVILVILWSLWVNIFHVHSYIIILSSSILLFAWLCLWMQLTVRLDIIYFYTACELWPSQLYICIYIARFFPNFVYTFLFSYHVSILVTCVLCCFVHWVVTTLFAHVVYAAIANERMTIDGYMVHLVTRISIFWTRSSVRLGPKRWKSQSVT